MTDAELMTVEEVAARWRMRDVQAVRDLCSAGSLVASKIGGRWLVEPEAVKAYEVSRRNSTPIRKRTALPRKRTA